MRFNGKPLAGKKLNMETEFGTRTTFVTDADGQATVLFPLDFKPDRRERNGRASRGPRRAKFVLAAEHDDGGKHYLTAFNYSYGRRLTRNRSLAGRRRLRPARHAAGHAPAAAQKTGQQEERKQA